MCIRHPIIQHLLTHLLPKVTTDLNTDAESQNFQLDDTVFESLLFSLSQLTADLIYIF